MRREKSLDLDDVFSKAKLYGPTGSASRSVAEHDEGNDTDTGRSVATTGTAKRRSTAGRKNGKRSGVVRKRADPRALNMSVGNATGLLKLLAHEGEHSDKEDDDEELFKSVTVVKDPVKSLETDIPAVHVGEPLPKDSHRSRKESAKGSSPSVTARKSSSRSSRTERAEPERRAIHRSKTGDGLERPDRQQSRRAIHRMHSDRGHAGTNSTRSLSRSRSTTKPEASTSTQRSSAASKSRKPSSKSDKTPETTPSPSSPTAHSPRRKNLGDGHQKSTGRRPQQKREAMTHKLQEPSDHESENEPEMQPKMERPGLGLRAPSLEKLDADVQSTHSQSEARLETASRTSRNVTDDSESEDASEDGTVLQFDPTQNDNVYRVRQVTTDHSNFRIKNADGTSTEGQIAEIVDPVAEAQQLRRSEHQSAHTKDQPIFDFLDESGEDFHDDFHASLNGPSGGEEEYENNGRGSKLQYPSGGEEEGDHVAYPSGGEEDDGIELLNSPVKPATPFKPATFPGQWPKEADFDNDFGSADNGPNHDLGHHDADDEEIEQAPKVKKVKRKVKKKVKPGTKVPDNLQPGEKVKVRKVKKRKPAVVRRPSGGPGADPESEYDSEFSLDNINPRPREVPSLESLQKPHRRTMSSSQVPPISPSQIANKLWASFSNNDGDDGDEDDHDRGGESVWGLPTAGESTLSPGGKRKVSMGLATSIGRYFSRSRRNSPTEGGGGGESVDRDDVSVGGASLSGRLFRGKKKHTLLGDDSSCDSGAVF